MTPLRLADPLRRPLARGAEVATTLLMASVLVWALVLVAPGDAADRVLRARGVVEPEPQQLAEARVLIGADGNPVERYLRWLWRAARGDLSVSWVSGRDVATEIGSRLGGTLMLSAVAIVMAVAITISLALAASLGGPAIDGIARLYSSLFASIPGFLLGLCTLQFLVVGLGWGQVISDGSLATVWWPAASLAIPLSASWSRYLRAGLAGAMASSYVEVALARGASRLRLLVVHALPNATVSFLGLAGIGVGALLGGAPITETIFTWPGVGKYAIDAVGGRDLPVIQAFALLSAIAYVAISLLFDVVAARIDPRVAQATERTGAR